MFNRKFIYNFFIFLIILTIIPLDKVYAVGIIENYINQQSAKECSDRALAELFGQTGYKVANQEEIDALRNKCKKENPELFKKYPFIFVGAQDSFPVSDSFSDDYSTYCSENQGGYTSIYTKIGADLRSWINSTIDSISDKTISTGVTNTGGSEYVEGRSYNVDSSATGFDLVISTNGSPATGGNSVPLKLGGVSITSYTVEKITHKDYFYPGSDLLQTQVKFYDKVGNLLTTKSYSNDPPYNKSFPTVFVIQLDGNGNSLDSISYTDTKDNSWQKTDYIPYPQTVSGGSTVTVPQVLEFPKVSVLPDGTLTPELSPIEFPTEKTEPDEDGYVKKDDVTIKYEKPKVDPDTGTIVDPDTDKDKDDPFYKPDDTGNSAEDLDVPKDSIPELDFRPLMIATRKFPFCIPWDLYSCVKIFDSDEEPFSYEFKEVKYSDTDIIIIPNFKLDFSTIPHINTIRRVFKFFLYLLFIVFLIKVIRGLMRS